MARRGAVGACMKLVEVGSTVDPLTGAVVSDPLSAGPSPADEAALEWALRAAERFDAELVVVTAIPARSSGAVPGKSAGTRMLRAALACGATRAVIAELPAEAGPAAPMDLGASSHATAACLAAALEEAGCSLVFCGDASLDRGTGAVPAYLAALLTAAQALGVIGVDLGSDGAVEVERRLDEGRRERLRIGPETRGVISVEAPTARLRRASVEALLAARSRPVDPRPAAAVRAVPPLAVSSVGPFRPRARVVDAPSFPEPSGRIRQLAGVLTSEAPRRLLALPPPEAADLIVSTLLEWGEL